MAFTDKQFLAQALLWKAWYKEAPSFHHPDYSGGQVYNYEGSSKYDIFQWARKEFPFYNKYSTNEELTQRFFEDFKNGNSLLLKEINAAATTELEPLPTRSGSSKAPEQQAPATTVPITKSVETNLPTTPPRPPVVQTIRQIIPPDQTVIQEPEIEQPTETSAPSSTESAPTTMPASTPSSPQTLNTSSFQPPRLNLPGFKVPNAAKNLGSSAGRFLKTNAGKIGRGIVGPGLNGAYNSLGRAGLGALHHGGNFLNRLSTTRSRLSASSASSKRLIWIFVGVLILLVIFGAIGGVGGPIPTGQAAPITPPFGGGGDISSCKFTRSGASNPIKSSTLASFFTEVAAKTGVPVAALASLAMHESQYFTSNADNNHDGFGSSNITMATGCTHFGLTGSGIGASSTGALGLMQVQPPKRIHDVIAAATQGMKNSIPPFESVGAYSVDGVERGAGFIGKTAGSLTLQDLCDVKTSIYLGAGVLISKNGGKPPTTGAEINKSVCGYYGSCVYGGHNYGDEAQKDFENCKPTAGTAPAPPGPIGVSLTCPLDSSTTITCGTAANPASTGCGHGVPPIYAARCNPYYYACDTLSTKYGDGTYERYSPGLYYAIDVTGRNEVKLPYINGNESVVWTRTESAPIYIGKNAEWGYRINFTTTYQGKKLYLDLTHLSAGLNNAASLNSGEVVGRHIETNQIKHLHIGLSIDGQWVEPAQQAKMCVQ